MGLDAHGEEHAPGHAHGHASGHAHGHAHGGGHGHAHGAGGFGLAFGVGAGLNAAFVVGEAIAGWSAHSSALLADAGHNLSDVLGLLAAWLASVLARTRPTRRFTYGLRGSSILAALLNAVVLLLVTGGIAAEAVERLVTPRASGGGVMMIVAAIGIVVNGATAAMFMRGRGSDLNARAAFAHMASDALTAFGVVVAGAVILATGWELVDPLVSLAVSALIVAGTWSLLRDSVAFALDAVPSGVDREAVETSLRALPGVVSVHDLHIWGMSTTEFALTAHLVRPGAGVEDGWLLDAARMLSASHGIGHATLQVEQGDPAHPCALASEARV